MSKTMIMEFHDAKLEQLAIRAETVNAEFSHACVFVEVGPEKYECWSYRVAIELIGSTNVAVAGRLAPNDSIGDGWITRLDGTREAMGPVGTAIACREFRCEFASGTTITIEASTAVMRPIERLRFLENWNGPLGI